MSRVCGASGGAAEVEVEACDSPWSALHSAACARGESSYVDAATSYSVFTEVGLLLQNGCCGSKCRHCPYGQQHVAAAQRDRKALPRRPVLLRAQPRPRGRTGEAPLDVQGRRAVLWRGEADGGPGSLAVVVFAQQSGAVLLTGNKRACPQPL